MLRCVTAERCIDSRQWGDLRRATRMYLTDGGTSPAAFLLRSHRAYREHGLKQGTVTTCGVLGFPVQHADLLLLMLLADMDYVEIMSAYEARALPDEDSLRLLLALRGVTVPAARPRRSKRVKRTP